MTRGYRRRNDSDLERVHDRSPDVEAARVHRNEVTHRVPSAVFDRELHIPGFDRLIATTAGGARAQTGVNSNLRAVWQTRAIDAGTDAVGEISY